MKNMENKEMMTILKVVAIICALTIFIEICYVVYHKNKIDKNTTYYDGLNSIVKIEDGYLGAGSSDFKHSKKNSYTKVGENGKLVKYDNDGKIIWEKKYENEFGNGFYQAIEVSDGYLALGLMIKDEKQKEEDEHDALMVKYDKEGNTVFEKTFNTLGNAVFKNAIEVDDGYLVVGQSIYAPMVLGNDDQGGAVLIKYDKEGNEIWKSFYAGTKSGIFHDLVIVDNAIYAVGKDAANTGILVKYDLNGNREWIKNYSFTDSIGFSSIALTEDHQLIVSGSRKKNDEDKNDYKNMPLLVKYDLNGKILWSRTYENTVDMGRFHKVVVEGDSYILVGHVAIKDEEKSTDTTNVFRYNGIIGKYKSNGDLEYTHEFGGSMDDYFTDILVEEDNYLVVGYSNSKDKDLAKSKQKNGKDFFTKWVRYAKDGVLKQVK